FFNDSLKQLRAEVGFQAGEVLLGRVAPAVPMGGLRSKLDHLSEDRYFSDNSYYEDSPSLGRLLGDFPQSIPATTPWVDALTRAGRAFDAAAERKPPD